MLGNAVVDVGLFGNTPRCHYCSFEQAIGFLHCPSYCAWCQMMDLGNVIPSDVKEMLPRISYVERFGVCRSDLHNQDLTACDPKIIERSSRVTYEAIETRVCLCMHMRFLNSMLGCHDVDESSGDPIIKDHPSQSPEIQVSTSPHSLTSRESNELTSLTRRAE